jgi:hypothetical protein
VKYFWEANFLINLLKFAFANFNCATFYQQVEIFLRKKVQRIIERMKKNYGQNGHKCTGSSNCAKNAN